MNPVIFIADDNPADIDLLQLAYEECHLQASFILAADGLEAIDRLRGIRPSLVMLDIKMPRADGFEVLKALRADERLRHVPVIVMSSSNSHLDRQRALELGATYYWMKPGRFDELVKMVAGVSSFISPG